MVAWLLESWVVVGTWQLPPGVVLRADPRRQHRDHHSNEAGTDLRSAGCGRAPPRRALLAPQGPLPGLRLDRAPPGDVRHRGPFERTGAEGL